MTKNKIDDFITSISKKDKIYNYILIGSYAFVYYILFTNGKDLDIKYFCFFNCLVLIILLAINKIVLKFHSRNKIQKSRDFISTIPNNQLQNYISYLESLYPTTQPFVISDIISVLLTPLITYLSHLLNETLDENMTYEIKLLFFGFSTFYLIRFTIYFLKHQARQECISLLKNELYKSLLS